MSNLEKETDATAKAAAYEAAKAAMVAAPAPQNPLPSDQPQSAQQAYVLKTEQQEQIKLAMANEIATWKKVMDVLKAELKVARNQMTLPVNREQRILDLEAALATVQAVDGEKRVLFQDKLDLLIASMK